MLGNPTGFLRKNGVFEKVVFEVACGFWKFEVGKMDFVFKRLCKWKLEILGFRIFGDVWGLSGAAARTGSYHKKMIENREK